MAWSIQWLPSYCISRATVQVISEANGPCPITDTQADNCSTALKCPLWRKVCYREITCTVVRMLIKNMPYFKSFRLSCCYFLGSFQYPPPTPSLAPLIRAWSLRSLALHPTPFSKILDLPLGCRYGVACL